ncbi:MAG: AAA-like domain-containing protein [Prevotellaceae bacterium]|jgi:hypothetical protein|nr:AAA-like domain-containing protein [Prevotellaceae bacterium]
MKQVEWKSPSIIVGQVATAKFYYPRPEVVKNILEKLDKGNSLLLAAPRRVGKTSIMQYIQTHPANYKMAFADIEGINSAQRFYATIYRMLLECLSLSKTDRIKEWLRKYCNIKSISEIDIKGKIKIETLPLDFLKEIDHLVTEINRSETENIALLIDELPDMLFKMHKNEKTEEARSILKNLRSWRQDPKFRNIRFVFAGSVGIHHVVNIIEQRNSDLNDLVSIPCKPLSKKAVSEYIEWATKEATVKYNDEMKKHLAEKIRYYVPFFINLMLDEIDRSARKTGYSTIGKQQINKAFNAILSNNDYFDDWRKRLSDYLPPADFKFVNELLTHIAHKKEITIQEIYDKALAHNKTENYMDFVDDLEKDGYIVQIAQKYMFISPLLEELWKRKNPIYKDKETNGIQYNK